MLWSLSLPGKLAALAFIVASGAMNWMFMLSQGHGVAEGHILGAVSVAITVFNAILPFRIRRAVELRKFVAAAMGGVALVLFLSFSLISAIGFAALNRGAVSGDREMLNVSLGLAEAELKELEADRAAQKTPARAASAIEQELAALRVKARWTSSKECTDATVGESRTFCEGYLNLKGEFEAAVAGARKDQRRADLRTEVKELRARGAGRDIDPQASMLTRIVKRWVPRIDFSDVKMLLTLFVAALVEFGAAFGLYLAAGIEAEAWPQRKRMEVQPDSGRKPERFRVEHANSLLSSIAGRH